MRRRSGLQLLIAAFACASAPGGASARGIVVRVDTAYAEKVLATVCSGKEIDEATFRAMPELQGQIRHHQTYRPKRSMDAFIDGLKAAARCETPEDDVFGFGALVEDRAVFKRTVDFYAERSGEIADFISEALSPYLSRDAAFKGALVFSVVGNPCGGFASEGDFYLALNCLRANPSGELPAVKTVAAHEVFHALQSKFFFPYSEDIESVKTRDEAVAHLFSVLIMEGTAEYVADSRKIQGKGALTEYLTDFAGNGYGQGDFHIRLFGYAAEQIASGEDFKQRLKDAFQLGFTGQNRQIFYYAGAQMAGAIENQFGREALVCIFVLAPEQFVLAHDAAARANGTQRLSEAALNAARRLAAARENTESFEACAR